VDEAGQYTLKVTNANNGCTATTSVTVNQSSAVGAGISNVAHVSCNGGNNGSATATGSGGSGTYTYTWSTGANTAIVNNLPAGIYMVTVADSENCTATASVTINEPASLAANASATGETAAGANDGTASAAPSGGTPAYSYLWSTGATTATISGLAPGSYTVTVTDANNCTAIQTVTVNSFNCTLTAAISFTNVTCNGAGDGTASVTLSGAAMPVTYLWSNGDTSATVTNLTPGTYTVDITDANNCPAELSVTISQPPQLLPNASSTNQSGVGQNDGTATAQPTGGTPSYTYVWSNNETTQTITGLAPGAYTVTVTDANDCTAVQTVTVNAFNCTLTGSISVAHVSCFGGSDGQATAVPAGTTQSVTYTWSNGGNTNTISNLTAGIYTVTLTDAAGCVAISTATVNAPAQLLADVTEINHVECPEDKDGSVVVALSGGTVPYQISWPDGSNGQNLGVGTYTFTVTDGNGCSITQTVEIVSNDTIPPAITCPAAALAVCPDVPVQYSLPPVSDNCSLNNTQPELVSGLPSGSVFPVGETVQVFRITDVSGNSATCSFAIVAEPPLSIELIEKAPDVNNAGVGSINVAVSGGAGMYAYSWTKDGQPFANTEDLTGLKEGIYILTVTTIAGCTAVSDTIQINNTVNTGEPVLPATIRVIPNPAHDVLRLEMNGLQPVAIRILDMHGRLIRNLEPTEWATGIDVSSLPHGMYNLNLLSEKGLWKVVKWIKAE
ncbi:MAG: T9SS type A sorting domain-containing protein, partial [Thermoanaerobaculia bacterium]|nr:T9SS type A sorting domain-containing protein [Thermoanaerobaculia bacterium]